VSEEERERIFMWTVHSCVGSSQPKAVDECGCTSSMIIAVGPLVVDRSYM
jgi:hypothetical protein